MYFLGVPHNGLLIIMYLKLTVFWFGVDIVASVASLYTFILLLKTRAAVQKILRTTLEKMVRKHVITTVVLSYGRVDLCEKADEWM